MQAKNELPLALLVIAIGACAVFLLAWAAGVLYWLRAS